LSIPVAFSGRLLVGADVVADAPFLHMGFFPAWMYLDVYELVFDRGGLVSSVERSAELAAVRDRLGDSGARPRVNEPVKEWISRTFSLTFDYSWPSTTR